MKDDKMDRIVRTTEPKRPFQAEDVKTILKGIDKILNMYEKIVTATMRPSIILDNKIAQEFKNFPRD